MAKITNPRKQYLLDKMFDGARALYEFFETIKEDTNAEIPELKQQLKTKYELTSNQQKYLDEIAGRASKARAVIQYFENKYGLNPDKTFKKPQELHDFLFKKKPYSKKVRQAKSYNIGIGFTCSVWRDDEIAGSKSPMTTIDCPNLLFIDSRETISRLERGLNTMSEILTFHIPCDSRIAKIAGVESKPKTIQEKLLYYIFKVNPDKFKQQIIEHELRHVIDEII
jgi:hypothetical protein